ncbi:hypothetical protein RND71_027158 [Anisodus tanguticus]|uniref:S-protein homolog n=1 Tax=Anisodus tanguticus TaxID=243964 RepID=A0AAE1RPP1_9SOLA|nr:hypothetical protein RND71_027158 [Anisodus tanguticus]
MNIITLTQSMTLLIFVVINFSHIEVTSRSPPNEKLVVVKNNHTNYLSIRCFSFDDYLSIKHLKSNEEFSFKVNIRTIFPTATMFNCSTNMGTFMAFRSNYQCVTDSDPCQWMFDENFTYRYHSKDKELALYEYNPNYESLTRGGIMKGFYVN